MRMTPRALLLLFAILYVSVAVASETATVTRVVDGDTLVVDIAGQEERVRLIGVDTRLRPDSCMLSESWRTVVREPVGNPIGGSS